MNVPISPGNSWAGYMRNCAMRSAAGQLEFVLLERLNVLKGIPSTRERRACPNFGK
jgi:hypothetical protein